MAGKNFQQFIKISWTKINFYNLTSIAYTHPPVDKYTTKAVYDHAKNVKLCINLVPCSSWDHCWMKTFVLDVLSFHMLSAWVKHQIVNINNQGLT